VRTRLVWLALAAVVVLSAGCTAGPNDVAGTPDADGDVAGFWHGLWHGFIVLFTFVVSLFSDSVRIYEVHNSGNWYNFFGFLLGLMAFFGGGGGEASRRSRCGSRRKTDETPD
jgi:hypothetical protein